MLFKLSIKNMKKSFKDYAIYFITLVLGVALFYMFNSLDSQEAMLEVSSSTKEMIKLMINMLSMVSVFIAIILSLLIVYANTFLINRRKKEFGIYMTLGMGKRQISKILLIETVFVGIISLAIGLILGIFASQFMSILVAKLFQADMSKFEFVFSRTACIKTCIYFAVMYIAVIIFNVFTISRYKLINLLTAIKKNEKIKIVEDLPRQQIKVSKQQKKKQFQMTVTVIGLFLLLLTISCRNSQIDKQFNQIQNQKKELASIQKENEQLKVNIQNSINLSNIEKLAKEELGMEKLTNKQTVYVSLPKKDYVEAPTEKVVIEKEMNWLEKLFNKFLKK
mgnify:CR=1 FL=1